MNPNGKNGRKARNDEERVIPPRGDYQTLHAFHKAQVVYDIAFRFRLENSSDTKEKHHEKY